MNVRRGGPVKVSEDETPLPQYLEKSGMPPGGWLKRMRLMLGYSRAEVAAKAGIGRETLRNLENSEAVGTITLNSLRKVAAAMDGELIYFLSNNGSVAPTFFQRLVTQTDENKGSSVPSPTAAPTPTESTINGEALKRTLFGAFFKSTDDGTGSAKADTEEAMKLFGQNKPDAG